VQEHSSALSAPLFFTTCCGNSSLSLPNQLVSRGKLNSFLLDWLTLSFLILLKSSRCVMKYRHHHHHHHKHQGMDPLNRSVSKVTAALSNVSSVFQLFSFLVVCSGMISKGFGFVAFFASVETSSVCIHISCLVCL